MLEVDSHQQAALKISAQALAIRKRQKKNIMELQA